MRTSIFRQPWCGTVTGVLVATLLVTPIVSADCDDRNANFRVCASWITGGDPTRDQDYAVIFHGSDAPDIELITGREDWRIVVTNASGTAPASIGMLTVADNNFTVNVVTAGGAVGAVNVDSVDLTPNGNYRCYFAADVRRCRRRAHRHRQPGFKCRFRAGAAAHHPSAGSRL